MHACIHRACIHTYIHADIHSSMHTYIHTYIHTYTHTYTHTHIHTYIHTSIHPSIHTYIHTYIIDHDIIVNIHVSTCYGCCSVIHMMILKPLTFYEFIKASPSRGIEIEEEGPDFHVLRERGILGSRRMRMWPLVADQAFNYDGFESFEIKFKQFNRYVRIYIYTYVLYIYIYTLHIYIHTIYIYI